MLASGLAAACSGGSSSPDAAIPDAMPDPACMEGPGHSDFEWIQEKILDVSCSGFSTCHMGSASQAGDLNLEAGMAFDNIVDVPSDVAGDLGYTMDIVEPGNPSESYILHILGRYGVTPEENPRLDPEILTMPYNNPRLCVEKIDVIERWIESLPAQTVR